MAGIQVSLHFSWFFVAAFQLSRMRSGYHSPIFALYEYLALFLIVLLHEFGHAFACRQVGGTANYILLWPFGGVAFVRPPSRPGAQLWSIAAGPLVNVALIPLIFLLNVFVWKSGIAARTPDFYRLVVWIGYINAGILVFNLLPVYPLDGGQILRSLLWFPLGRTKSLRIASVIGLIGGSLFALWGISSGSWWIALLAFFLLSQAIAGWRQAKLLQREDEEGLRLERAPERPVL